MGLRPPCFVVPNEGKEVTATAERLWQMIEPYLLAEGVELDDLEVRGEGPGTIVRVTVDSEKPVGVDHIARLSRALSRLLDEKDPVTSAYTLEVSSPGLERKLRRPRHYEKSLGREVKVKTLMPVEEAKNHRGVLTASDNAGFEIEVDGRSRRISYEAVASASTIFVWEKSPKPGKQR